MTDTLREECEALLRWINGEERDNDCECSQYDFTDWPSDLEKACGYCRTILKLEAFAKHQRAAGLREAMQCCDEHHAKDHWYITKLRARCEARAKSYEEPR